ERPAQRIGLELRVGPAREHQPAPRPSGLGARDVLIARRWLMQWTSWRLAGALTLALIGASCALDRASVGSPEPDAQPASLPTAAAAGPLPPLLVRVQPLYPRKLAALREEGWVVLSIVVDKDGSVVDPIVEDSTSPGFEAPALDAVRRWRYAPRT